MLIQQTLLTIVNEDGNSVISRNKIAPIYMDLMLAIESLREEDYQRTRDIITTVKFRIIDIKNNLSFSPQTQAIFDCVLTHITCITDELFYKQLAINHSIAT